ncbi:putative WD repeat-containing protein 27-like [Trypanosoma conorhini]|uniref:Putative WD repeat-containing protein 27-like n=1 Tax=Trypanosoma conorhini TaxID=83891 RepID=A0A422P651_9TRYP|nr:putative WD repeat-containing protein 27-like [Trypanosoma conorhini]RNF13198.1 putative WD repeat-containing protein 27-like [Trypanosoma conorhini]
MPQLDERELRALYMGADRVTCVDVSSKCLLWCVEGGRAATLHMWESREEQPSTVPLVELGFVPTLISAMEEKVVVVGDRVVALFTVEWPSFSAMDLLPVDEEDEKEGGNPTVREVFTCSEIPAGVTHVSWATDGTAAALSAAQQLVLMDCRVGYNDASHNGHEFSPCLMVDCSSWYGDPGAAFTAFTASRLFLLSTRNHLVMTRFSDNNDCGGQDVCYYLEPRLERDGHVIARAHQVTCFAVGGSEEGYLVAGLSDGTVKLLRQDSMEVFFTLDVAKQLYRLTGRPPPPDTGDDGVEVLSISVGRRCMLVVRPDAAICYDKKSMELIEEKTMFLFGRATMSSRCAGDGSWCAWSPQTQELLYYAAPVQMFLAADNNADIVHAQVPLPSKLLEPLSLPYQKEALSACSGKGADKKKPKNKFLTEKPVTHGHVIKSSGYATAVPWSVQQQRAKQARERVQKGVQPSRSVASDLRYRPLPLFGRPFEPMTKANKILSSSPIHRAMVTDAVFAAAGSALLTASADTTANWLKYPVARNGGEGTLMEVHTSPANAIDVSLSLNAPFVATGAADGVVAMWQPTKREAPYIVQKVAKEVRAVKFFYTDKFLCYAAGNTVSFCRYALDDGGGELHRNRNESTLETVLEFAANSAQSVVAVDAINYFTSNVMVWAGSNKSVGVYDVSVGQSIQVVEEAHLRPIHHVAMLTSSRYAAPSTNLLHTYLTAGLDSTVRLWDLRQRRSVRQLALHRNTAAPVGAALSPNGAAVAVGSETRDVVIYDVGSGAVVNTINVGDTPTALSWHPLESVLAVGTATGAIKLMGQR